MITVEKIDNNIDHVRLENIDKLNVTISDDLRSELIKMFEIPNSKVIFDLSGVKYIDSSGFGCFLNTMKASRNNYGIFRICNIDPDVLKLFKALQLHTVLDIYDDLDSCIKSFQA